MMYLEDRAPVRKTVSPRTPPVASLPDATPLFGRLLSIAKSVRALTALHLAGIDLYIGQDQFLDVLTDEKALAMSDVALALNVRPSTVSKMADRMVEKGLVERVEDDGDCRRTLLRVTPAGSEKRREVYALWSKLEDQLAGHDRSFGSADVTAALGLVDTVLTARLSRLR